jgi:hypothetical protein
VCEVCGPLVGDTKSKNSGGSQDKKERLRVAALIWAVCTDLCGSTRNLSYPS